MGPGSFFPKFVLMLLLLLRRVTHKTHGHRMSPRREHIYSTERQTMARHVHKADKTRYPGRIVIEKATVLVP